jgi:hypothetical protein
METINAVAEEDDVWKGNFVSVKAPAKESHKVTALRESIAYHLKVSKEIADKKKIFCVARHHWSRSLLRKLGKGHRTKLVTEAEVKGFDSEDGHSQHQEECNLFLTTLRRGFTGEITKKYEKKKKKYYVQAPVVDENTALNFVKSLTSSRKKSSDDQSISQLRESSESSGDEKKEEHTMKSTPARRDHDSQMKLSGAKREPTTRKRNWDGVVYNPVLYAPPPHPTLDELLDLKANNIRIFYSLSLEHCDIETIDILFPKHAGRGILDPPPPYRISASKLYEWRTRGNRHQREEISKHAKGSQEDDTQHSRRLGAREQAEESSEHEKRSREDATQHTSRRTRRKVTAGTEEQRMTPNLTACDKVQQTTATGKFLSIPPDNDAKPVTTHPMCQGVLLESLLVDNRDGSEHEDLEMIQAGFANLVGEAIHNMATACSERQEWPLDPSRHHGVLFNHNFGNVYL